MKDFIIMFLIVFLVLNEIRNIFLIAKIENELQKLKIKFLEHNVFHHPESGITTDPMKGKKSCFKCGLVHKPGNGIFTINIDDNFIYCNDCYTTLFKSQ